MIGDTVLLIIRHLHEPDSPVLDTTAFDHRTLAPLWSHEHFQQGASASWEFRGRRILWSAVQPSGATESLDSTLEEPGFFAGTTDVLLPATPHLYVPGGVIVFSFIDLRDAPGESASFTTYTVAVRVTGSEVVPLPNGARVDAWVVRADEPPDGRTYWIDKRSHEVVKWYVPRYESICPTTYERSLP